MPELQPEQRNPSELPEIDTRESLHPPPTYSDATDRHPRPIAQPNTTRVVRQQSTASVSTSLCHIYLAYTRVTENDKSDITTKRITLTSSSNFEDFQLQVRQIYFDLPTNSVDKSFTWSTWYYHGNNELGERTLVCEHTWDELKMAILKLRNVDNKPAPARGEFLKLRTTVLVARWAERQKVRDVTQLRVPTKVWKNMERVMLLQGRYVAEPVVEEKTCVVM